MSKIKIKEFDIEGDPASIGVRWKKWLTLLEDNFDWLDIDDAKKKVKAMRLYGGERLRDLIDTLPDPTNDNNMYEKTTAKLNAFFVPKKNTDILVNRFRNMRQLEDESVNDYYARLRQEATKCEFHNMDLEIKRHLQDTMNDRRLARKATKDQLSLEKILQEAQVYEQTERYERDLLRRSNERANMCDKESDTSYVNKMAGKYSRQRRTEKQTESGNREYKKERSETKSNAQFDCRRCGRRHAARNCAAYGETCRKCGKQNHFARMCRSNADDRDDIKPRASGAGKSRVDQIQSSDSDSSTSDEFVQTIETVRSTKKSAGKPRQKINNIDSYPTLVKLALNGVKTQMAVDSGASVNIMDEKRFQKIQERSVTKLHLRKCKTKIYGYASNKSIALAGKFDTIIENKRTMLPVTFVVVKGTIDSDILLGYETATQLGILKIVKNVKEPKEDKTTEPRSEVTQLISKHDSLFHGIGKHKHAKVKIEVKEDVTPVALVNCKIPYHYHEQVKEQLQQLEDAHVIEPVPEGEPTTWISPLVIQPKKTPGEIRICVDMRKPNTAMKRMKREFPTIEDVIQDLNGATTFSKLDLNHGYHQLELDPASRHLTTFNTPWGLKRYTRLNFGTVIAQEVFHEEIKKTVAGINGVKNISDDIIVYGKTQAEHDQSLQHTLERLKDHGLTLNRKKCSFDQSEIEFFGYVFSAKGLSPDPAKVEALRTAEKPTNMAEVRSFLGMANYSARFIRNFATLAAPLRALTKKDAKWKWTETEEKAFHAITNHLTDDTVMGYYKTQQETEVIVDASPVGLGAILAQRGDGQFRPVTYVSRALTPVEQRYSQTEREALAIRWACERLRMYLAGTSFKIVTDHKPLVYIFNNPASKLPMRIERWSMYLQEFDFLVEYRSGKTNPADYMSRHPCKEKNDHHQRHQANRTERVVKQITANSVPTAMTLQEIKEATEKDSTINKIKDIIQSDNREARFNEEDLKPYKTIHLELSIVDGLLLRQTRIVMPTALRRKVIKLSHEGHQGIVKSKQLLRQMVWFPGIDKMVEKEVRKCLPCQAATPYKQVEPLQMTELPEEPWQNISVDFCGPYPTGEYCLVMVDDYSRYPVVEVIHSTSAAAVIPKLDKIFAMFGIPKTCKTDNGPPFQSEEFATYAKEQGFKHRKITPLHPAANGEAERFVKTLQKHVRTATTEKTNWKKTMPTFLRMYRATPHASTGKTPYSLLFGGREMRGKIPQVAQPAADDDNVRARDAKSKQKMKEYADQRAHAKTSIIEKGDTVLLRQEKQNKLSSPFEGTPYTVQQRKDSMIIATRTSDGREVTRNASHFKKFIPSSETLSDAVMSSHEQEEEEEGEIRGAPKTPMRENQNKDGEPGSKETSQPMNDQSTRRYPTRERQKPQCLGDFVCDLRLRRT